MRVQRPLIAHLLGELSVGGMELSLIRMLNEFPKDRYRHAILTIKDVSPIAGLLDGSVEIMPLRIGALEPKTYSVLIRALRHLKPEVIHSRNLGCIEGQLCAYLAGVPVRIHSEHGHDMLDLHGRKTKYRLLRKALRPLTHQFIAVSQDLANWLASEIGVSTSKIKQISNGVDIERFASGGIPPSDAPSDFFCEGSFVVGAVLRMHEVKNPELLVRAFQILCERNPALKESLKLVMVGDGPLLDKCKSSLEQAGLTGLAWLPGERSDIPQLMSNFDVLVVPSLREGISNVILEGMAARLPVVATRVGGNPEIVIDNETGRLFDSGRAEECATAIEGYVMNRQMASLHGKAGRGLVERTFSRQRMVEEYCHVYDRHLSEQGLAGFEGMTHLDGKQGPWLSQ